MKDLRDPKTGQIISLDRASNSEAGAHGASYWKLYDHSGRQLATLNKDGYCVRAPKNGRSDDATDTVP